MAAPQRIVVIGTSCAGKTTFARRLAERTGRPRIELDALYWLPGWRPRPAEEFRQGVDEASAAEAWVADGNYGAVRDLLWQRAQAIVWLNYAFPLVLWRAFTRTLARCLSREAIWNGNRESWRRSFMSRQSIFFWVATTHRRRRHDFARLRAAGDFAGLQWIEFRHPGEAARWLDLNVPAAPPASRTSPAAR